MENHGGRRIPLSCSCCLILASYEFLVRRSRESYWNRSQHLGSESDADLDNQLVHESMEALVRGIPLSVISKSARAERLDILCDDHDWGLRRSGALGKSGVGWFDGSTGLNWSRDGSLDPWIHRKNRKISTKKGVVRTFELGLWAGCSWLDRIGQFHAATSCRFLTNKTPIFRPYLKKLRKLLSRRLMRGFARQT